MTLTIVTFRENNGSVLADRSICFVKTVNKIEVQKYLFGINCLNDDGLFNH